MTGFGTPGSAAAGSSYALLGSSGLLRDGVQLFIDWSRSGSFADDPLDEVTFRTAGGSGGSLFFGFGRDQSTALAPMVTGRGSMLLKNEDKRFNPRNTASPLFGRLKPARPVLCTRTVAGATYALFNGHTDDSPINPDRESLKVSMTLVDWLADFKGIQLSTPLYRGIRTGEAIGAVLDAAGWTGPRDLDLGASYLPWWWVEGGDALTALNDLMRAEGPPALLTVGADGGIIFRDRHHRINRAASTTSQGTWRAQDGARPRMARGFGYDEGWRLIVNDVQASVTVRRPTDLGVVWSSSDTITLSDGESTVINAQGSDPFFNAVTPVQFVDWQVLSGTMTAQLLRTSGLAVGIKLTATGGPASITGLQLRGVPVVATGAVTVSAVDSASVADYGPRGLPNGADLPFVSPYDAAAILGLIVSTRAQPLTQLRVRFVIGNDVRQAQALLPRDLGDRVTVIEPGSSVNGDFYVESIEHTLTGDEDHEVTFGLEACPAAITPLFRFDVAGSGFDQGRFGDGTNNSSNLFRFDVSGAGFDQGVFAS